MGALTGHRVTGDRVTEHQVSVPLRSPVAGLTAVRAVLVHGPAGWGERSTPPTGYPSDAAAARRAAAEAACGRWPPPLRDRVPVNALVPATGPATAARLAADAVAGGARCVKVKVGTPDDEQRVAAVRDAVGPRVALRLDANGSWSVDDAVVAITRLAPLDLELVEQPVDGLDDLARLRRKLTVAVPLAADESVRGIDDARRLRQLAAADAVVVKVQPLGGVAAALEVAEAAGVPVIVSALYETSIGLAAGLALAAALPELPYACGLGGAALLSGDVVADPLLPEGGELVVRRPVPDPTLLARYAT